MIEHYENAIQIAALAVCATVAIYKAIICSSRSWTMLALFYGSWLLGDIYWLLCLVFYGDTPQISVVADLSWFASFLFLYLLLRHTSPPEELGPFGVFPWFGPVFSVGMAVFFMLRGEILSNLVYAGLMGLLLFTSIRRLVAHKVKSRLLSTVVFIFCLLEYALWIASCFWNDDATFQVYYLFDILLTACFPFFLPATEKAVAEKAVAA